MDFGFPIALLNGIANFAALSACTCFCVTSPHLTLWTNSRSLHNDCCSGTYHCEMTISTKLNRNFHRALT